MAFPSSGEGPQTPFELARHIRRRLPELLRQCDFKGGDLNGWIPRRGELVPTKGPCPGDSEELERCFYEALRMRWLSQTAFLLNQRVGIWSEQGNLISPLLFAWEKRLEEMRQEQTADACSEEGSR